LADRFISIDTDGSIGNRAKFLADAKASKCTSVDVEHFHITVFGNTAVATMVFKSSETDAKGKPSDTNARWADTWVKMPSGAGSRLALSRQERRPPGGEAVSGE